MQMRSCRESVGAGSTHVVELRTDRVIQKTRFVRFVGFQKIFVPANRRLVYGVQCDRLSNFFRIGRQRQVDLIMQIIRAMQYIVSV